MDWKHETMKNKTQLNYIEILRAFATVLVVIGHALCVCLGAWGHKVFINEGMGYILFKWIYSFHMPLFAFITGYLFYYQFEIREKKVTVKKFLIDKIRRLIIPLFIFKYFLLQPIWAVTEQRAYPTVESYLINTEVGYLWFLYIIFAIYMTLYFIKFIRKKAIVSSLVVLIACNCFSGYFPSQVNRFLELLFYAILGMLLCKKTIYNKIKVRMLPLYISVYMGLYVVTQYNEGILGNVTGHLSRMMIMIILLMISQAIHCNNQTKAFISVISVNSMGIYLFHEPMLEWVAAYENFLPHMNMLFETVVLVVISILMSIVITILIKKSKLGWIIGEK